MPIHDLGYRHWEGELTPTWSRFWVVAQSGIRLAWQSRWVRRLLLAAWLPALYMAPFFFFLERGLSSGGVEMFRGLPQAEWVLNQMATADMAAARHEAWAWFLWFFFRYLQGFVMILVVGVIAAPLVARDVHSRAFLLYFSRPLSRLEYVAGKLTVIVIYVTMLTAAPALVLYVLGVLVSPPDLGVLAATWDLPFRILLASAVLIVPTATLALALSSMTSKTMYAGFAWFAVWVLGWVAYGTLEASSYPTASEHWSLLSLYHTLGKVQSVVFGLPVNEGPGAAAALNVADAFPSMLLLAVVTVVSTVVLFRRVSSPMRI
ncbi:MAG: ABC transporter permease subunit [Planctomycetota bacterium]|jgi:ABC-type transport system involved in multi-copper enzyme maturation permease subunit